MNSHVSLQITKMCASSHTKGHLTFASVASDLYKRHLTFNELKNLLGMQRDSNNRNHSKARRPYKKPKQIQTYSEKERNKNTSIKFTIAIHCIT